jgi:hypothetical protein
MFSNTVKAVNNGNKSITNQPATSSVNKIMSPREIWNWVTTRERNFAAGYN